LQRQGGGGWRRDFVEEGGEEGGFGEGGGLLFPKVGAADAGVDGGEDFVGDGV
jgi:hypothetical protein